MEQKVLLRLLIFLLVVSYAVSLGAVPLSRSLNLADDEQSVQEFVEQGFMEQRNYKEFLEEEEGFIHGRMDVESNDYPGTGANNHHDPKPPGKT